MYCIKHLFLKWWPFHDEVVKQHLHIRNINVLRVKETCISHLSKGLVWAYISSCLASSTILIVSNNNKIIPVKLHTLGLVS